jgi:hypothetical protein
MLCFFLHPEHQLADGNRVPVVPGRPFQNGDVILCYDSGAGTTDWVLVRIQIGAGEAKSFEVIGSAGTMMPLDALAQDGSEEGFGGRYVDRVGYGLMVHSAALARVGADDLDRLAEVVQECKDYLVKYEPGRVLGIARDIGQTGLDNAVEECKILLDQAPQVSLNQSPLVPPDPRTGDYVARREDLEERLGPAIDASIGQIRKFMDDEEIRDNELKYVFAIGGNSKTPLVKEKLRNAFGARRVVDLPGKVDGLDPVMEAVARGATLSYRAEFTNLIPYDIVCPAFAEAGVPQGRLYYQNASLPKRSDWVRHTALAGGSNTLEVFIQMGDTRLRIGQFTLASSTEGREYKIHYEISRDWVLSLYAEDEGGVRQDLMSYPLR